MGINRYTIDEFRAAYPNEDACLNRIFELRFKGLICPKCESDNTFVRVEGRRSYYCPNCAFQLYPTKDTIFEKSTTPLTYWFYAIYLQTTTRNGVAAKELERQLNVCYKTALRMAHQIKILMADKTFTQLTGTVQVDETYIGGKMANKHNKERAIAREQEIDNKTPVMGFVNKNNLRMEVMTDLQTFKDRVKAYVDKSATLVTDSHTSYQGLDLHFAEHRSVNHSANEFVKDGYHTNTIEGVWSQLKRTIKGTHIQVSVKHLQKYVDEVAFRYMHRYTQETMFEDVLKRIV
jgi:transposase